MFLEQIIIKYIFSIKISIIMQSKKNQSPMEDIDEKLDQQFVRMLTHIESKYLKFNKHIQIRIQKWVEKLLQYDENTIWRKCRNNYISLLNQMVSRGKIGGIFLRMPPEKDIPNLSESEYRIIYQQIRQGTKENQQKAYEFSIKKVEQPFGDSGSQIVTPNCQTERFSQQQNNGGIKETQPCQHSRDRLSKARLLQQIVNLLARNHAKMQKNSEYQQIIMILNQLLCLESTVQEQQMVSKEQSAELRVEEGIQINKANLFQFGSPRGMTQMTYFKAALL